MYRFDPKGLITQQCIKLARLIDPDKLPAKLTGNN
jgi:hypothetical protein